MSELASSSLTPTKQPSIVLAWERRWLGILFPSRLPLIIISSSEVPCDTSCVCAPAFVLLHALCGRALSSIVDPSLVSSLEGSGSAPCSAPTSQSTLPTRLLFLSLLLYPLVGCGDGASTCSLIARGKKPQHPSGCSWSVLVELVHSEGHTHW